MNSQHCTANDVATNGCQESELPWSARVANHLIGTFPADLNLRERKVFLYGLFDGSRCRYVGQTCNPNKRLQNHVYKPSGKIFKHGPMKMKLLRSCSEKKASRLEHQIVFAYRRKGQCDLNFRDHFDGSALRKYGVKPERPEWKRIRKRALAAINHIAPHLAFKKRLQLAS